MGPSCCGRVCGGESDLKWTRDSDCLGCSDLIETGDQRQGLQGCCPAGLATLIFILDAEACALVVGVVIVVLATCFDDDLVWIIYNLSDKLAKNGLEK